MTKNKAIPTPNLIAETVSLCFKIFLAIFIATNIVWTIIYFKPALSRVGDTSVTITQNGNRDVVKQNI